ncbi:trafficking protein Mon1-domain-containing protein [Fomitopsis serialis]|uniref:trafficking protein Mon1-domain-containing protein n=1 Tax=Fomitopsis serialis TaxID=139415 RepID=UPI002008468A|nr:trafficking protein Mon1-domain-containing protein [Neoantrodia serialis]KAH9936335.1 trafficking protein Mon1-domain-containing protein [Neoantrodia serialis]
MSGPGTPRSRTPSRVGTPIPGLSRLTPPSVRPAPLISSRVYSHGSTSTVPTPVLDLAPIDILAHDPHEGASSSASSFLNLEAPTPEMLVTTPEAEVVTIASDQSSVSGRTATRPTEENSKQRLRDQLRRTLSRKESFGADTYPPRHRRDQDESDGLTSTIGIMQALISVFLDDGDKIRCINAGKTRITFLLRSPLYYVCVSSWGEPESKTRFHLEYLHLQILSVVSAEQLRRMFERRTNFDLRRLLSGAEPFLYSLLSRLEWDLAMATSSLQCLKVEPMLRKSVADVLVPTSKIKDILYMLLIAQERIITLVRPKKHSIHPSDLHVLVNTVYAPSIINSSASASWLPICLPKFNSSAFVNAYVMFLRRDADKTPNSETASKSDRASVLEKAAPEIGLVCVSGSADFEAVRNWCDTVSRRLTQDGLLQALSDAIDRGDTEYSVADLGIPGLRHFVYKSRSHVQVTLPLYEDPYDDLNEKRRLITLYEALYDHIHAKSGQGSTLKLQYIRTEKESVMGWITQPFELYLALSPLLPKSAIVNAANSVARWVQKEERRLFLRDAPFDLTGSIASPQDFLKAIGRSADTKVTAESWEDLWKFDRIRLKEAGLETKDRRYVLWCMGKYRLGEDPSDFSHPPKPRKKIRGHGPAVQNGKRIRSKRRQSGR